MVFKAITVVTMLLILGCSQARQRGPDGTQSTTGEGATQTANSVDQKTLWSRDGFDWPSFLGPGRDSKSAETNLNWASLNSPKIVWTHEIGEGYGAGSVANGRYYHFDRTDDTARLVCLNAETGDLLWKFTYPSLYDDIYGFDGGPRSSPVIDDGRVFIFGAEGMLHCLDSQSGELNWKVDTQKQFTVIQNFFGVGSTPIVHKDLLITIMGGSPERSLKVPRGQLDQVEPNHCAIVAFDKKTGFIKYQSGNDLASYTSPIVTSIGGKQFGLAWCRASLLAFELTSGEILWQFPWRARKFASVNASTPVVWNEQILLTESYGPGGVLLKFDGQKPSEIWSDSDRREKSIACHWCTPIELNGHAYASSGETTNSARLNCVNMATGQVTWSKEGLTRASLLYADEQIVCLGENGRLVVFRPDPQEFDETIEVDRQALRLVGPCWAAPILSHGYLYVRDKSKVVCLDLK